RTLAMVEAFRREERDTPVILMGYLNPIASYGPERFCRDAASAGVDGLIVVDLPTEEADMLAPHAAANGIDIIRLVAPTTVDTLASSLDANGRAGPHTAQRVLDQIRALAEGVRHARMAA